LPTEIQLQRQINELSKKYQELNRKFENLERIMQKLIEQLAVIDDVN
jgi:molecular chaperone GrpE (heat shock protein)